MIYCCVLWLGALETFKEGKFWCMSILINEYEANDWFGGYFFDVRTHLNQWEVLTPSTLLLRKFYLSFEKNLSKRQVGRSSRTLSTSKSLSKSVFWSLWNTVELESFLFVTGQNDKVQKLVLSPFELQCKCFSIHLQSVNVQRVTKQQKKVSLIKSNEFQKTFFYFYIKT